METKQLEEEQNKTIFKIQNNSHVLCLCQVKYRALFTDDQKCKNATDTDRNTIN